MLVVAVSDAPDPVKARTDLTYTIAVKNEGGVGANGVVATTRIASKTTLVSASPGCAYGDGNVVCEIGAIEAAGTAVVGIVTPPNKKGSLLATTTVTANEGAVVETVTTTQVK